MFICFIIVNNGGLIRPGQKKMKLKADEGVKGFCSIEVHPEGNSK